jgi:glycosyltransferase involved in cell wall biosynthesis
LTINKRFFEELACFVNDKMSSISMKTSVIICAYNSGIYLDSQLESILKQTELPPSLCLVISDDSDDAEYLCSKTTYITNSYNVGVRIVKGPQLGSACSNFLSAISLSDLGDWVFLSDQDDVWECDKFEKYLAVIEKLDSNTPQLIFSDASLIDPNGIRIHPSFYKYQGLDRSILGNDDILFKNCVQGATICINKKMINLIKESLEGEDTSKVLMHDWWIAILARYCGNWTFINEPLLCYRQHGNNIIGAKKQVNLIWSIIKSPNKYVRKLKNLKFQLELWNKVSDKLDSKCSYNKKHLSLSTYSRLIEFLIRLK